MTGVVIEPKKTQSILIGMLCGSMSVKMDTMVSLIRSLDNLAARGIKHNFAMIPGITGVDSARNILTEIFLRSEHSHLLMIDDDMAWAEDLPFRMFNENIDVLGVPYLRKNNAKPSWTVNHPVPDVELMNGRHYLMKVSSVATGMMMINRSVFDVLKPTTEHAIIKEDEPPVGLYFRHTVDANGKLKSEDFSFCEKARTAGFDIWAWVDEEIAHIGDYAFRGCYVQKLGDGMAFSGDRSQLKVSLE